MTVNTPYSQGDSGNLAGFRLKVCSELHANERAEPGGNDLDSCERVFVRSKGRGCYGCDDRPDNP